MSNDRPTLGKHGRRNLPNSNNNNSEYNGDKKPKLGLSPLNFLGENIDQQEIANIRRLTVTRSNGTPKTIMRKSAKYSPATKNVLHEAEVYKALGTSPYIFPYEGSSTSPNSSNNARSAFSGPPNVYFNMEHMEGSTLADYRKTADIRLAEARTLITKTAKALRWLATQGFTHGDIKLDNVYRDKTGKIRIFDFGSSKQFSANANMQHATLWDSARDMEAFVTWIIEPLAPIVDKLRHVNVFTKPGTNPQDALNNFYSAVIREYGEKTGGKGHKTRKHKKIRYSK